MSLFTDVRAALDAYGVAEIDTLAILGSGMSGCFDPGEYLPLHEGGSAVAGHTGRIGLLRRGGAGVLVSFGRRHLYEGYPPARVTELVGIASALGAGSLLVTNAAGGLNPRFHAGDIMLIEDCLATLIGGRVIGGAGEEGGSDPSPGHLAPGRRELFAASLHGAVIEGAHAGGVAIRRGVYAAVTGPGYETRAEIRMLRRMGADAVGMSTVPEAAEAVRLGMRAVGLSLITNILTDTTRVTLDHGDVVEQGRAGAARMRIVIEAALDALG